MATLKQTLLQSKASHFVSSAVFLVFMLTAVCSSVQAQATETDTLRYQAEHIEFAVVPNEGRIEVNLLQDDTARVALTAVEKVMLDGTRQQDFRISESEEGLQLQGDALRVDFERLDDRSLAVTWTATDQQLHDFEVVLDAGGNEGNEAFLGTGERFNAINQKGYMIPMVSQDNWGPKGVASYKPVAFYMSTNGYGVWIDSFAEGVVDFGSMDKDYTRLLYPEKKLRVVFMGGPDFGDILNAFTDHTGKAPVPPKWSFGLWKSRDVHHNEDSVMTDIRKMREYNLPSSVLVIDSPWERGYNDFVVNTDQFPNPERMFGKIREAGFVPCLWLTPFINSDNVHDMQGIDEVTSTYKTAAENGYLVHNEEGEVITRSWWKGEGGLIDFTNPEAEDWWHQQLLKTKKYGVKAFKFDDAEGSYLPEADYHDGEAYEMSNRYSMLYNRSGYKYINHQLDGNGVLIGRTGFTGIQQYPMSWAGDNHGDFSLTDGLPSVILGGQNAALSGIPFWGADIAGYGGTANKQLYIRWSQFSAFTPLMQIHSIANLAPWDFDQQTLDIFRKYAQLRMRLFPYLYQSAHEATQTGMPVMRPMALAFQNDEEARRHVFQYMYGEDFLVAPVYDRTTQRTVYLPEGTWIDHWTGERFEGPKTMVVDAPLEKLPLYVKAGAVIPRLPDGVETLVPRTDELSPDVKTIGDARVIEVWPGSSGSFETWDGIKAVLSERNGQKHLHVQTERERPLTLKLRYARPDNVKGTEVDVRYDQASKTTIVELGKVEGEVNLTW